MSDYGVRPPPTDLPTLAEAADDDKQTRRRWPEPLTGDLAVALNTAISTVQAEYRKATS